MTAETVAYIREDIENAQMLLECFKKYPELEAENIAYYEEEIEKLWAKLADLADNTLVNRIKKLFKK